RQSSHDAQLRLGDPQRPPLAQTIIVRGSPERAPVGWVELVGVRQTRKSAPAQSWHQVCNAVHHRGPVRRRGLRWGMTKKKIDKYRSQLERLSARLRGDIATLEEQARAPTSGQAGSNLSNAPMHLGDMATDVYLQELNATLLENEEYLRSEVLAAMERI